MVSTWVKHMKKKLLIIDIEYYPLHNANTSIVKRIISLIGEQYDIVLTTQNIAKAPLTEIESKVTIYRTPIHSLNQTINTGENGFVDLIKMMVFKAAFVLKRNSIDEKNAYFFVKEVCKHIDVNNFDLILSFSNPFESHLCASILSKKYGIPWIAYYLDPFFTNATLPSGNIIARKKAEENFLSNASKVIMTYPTNEDYLQAGVEFKEKIIKAEMPGITFDNVIISENLSRKVCKCYFIGNLYKDLRNPESVVNVFSMLAEFNIDLFFVGGYYGASIDFEKMCSKNVMFLGKKTLKEINEIYIDADILVNIGNLTDNQMPSKIFEYISTGKPIINIYKMKNCPTLKYLRKYPLSLNIFENDLLNDISKFANIIKEFCYRNKGKVVSTEYIKNNYLANTDIMVSKFLCAQIEETVMRKDEC